MVTGKRTAVNMLPDQALLTTGEVADALRVGPDTVTRWVKEGRLAAIFLPSGRHRFRRADVEALLGVEQAAAPDDEPAAVSA